MSRKIQIILSGVGVLLLVVLILPFLVPVNSFRPIIEEHASAALGRKVHVGNLSLSILRGSLSAENLIIADDEQYGQAPFLKARSLKVGVELFPLIFSKELNVTGVTIKEPEVTLLRNATGEWNFSSLGRNTGKIHSTDPHSGTPAFSVKKVELEDGRIVIGSTESKQRSAYEKVNVSVANFSMTTVFPVLVTVDFSNGGKFRLEGEAGPVNQVDSSLTPLEARLNVATLDLASTGFLDPAAGLEGLLDIDASLRSRDGVGQIKGKAQLSRALLVAGGSPASQPVAVEFNTNYDLRKNSGILSPSKLAIGQASAQVHGTYRTSGDQTVVDIKVNGHDMPAKDLASFLPALGIHLPKGASLPAGTLNADLNITGPTGRLVTSGNVGLFDAKLAGFDLGSKLSTVSSLAGIKTGRDLNIEKLTTNLRIAPEGLRAENFLAVVPSVGNLAGRGTINSKNILDFKMAAILTNTSATSSTPVSGAMGMLGKLTGGSCGSGTTVPFIIQGTASDPRFVPDVGGIAAGAVKSQLGCATGGTGGTQRNSANPLGGITGLFEKKK